MRDEIRQAIRNLAAKVKKLTAAESKHVKLGLCFSFSIQLFLWFICSKLEPWRRVMTQKTTKYGNLSTDLS